NYIEAELEEFNIEQIPLQYRPIIPKLYEGTVIVTGLGTQHIPLELNDPSDGEDSVYIPELPLAKVSNQSMDDLGDGEAGHELVLDDSDDDASDGHVVLTNDLDGGGTDEEELEVDEQSGGSDDQGCEVEQQGGGRGSVTNLAGLGGRGENVDGLRGGDGRTPMLCDQGTCATFSGGVSYRHMVGTPHIARGICPFGPYVRSVAPNREKFGVGARHGKNIQAVHPAFRASFWARYLMDVFPPCDIASGCVYSASDSIDALVNHKQHICSKNISTEVNVVPEIGNTSSEVGSSNATAEKVLGKYATFPSSRKLADPVSAVGNDDVLDISCDGGQCSMASDNPAYARSISLPTSLKLVSAMKGNRERQEPHEKFLTVRWAPDVYDPPVTSLSHTVKGYSQQRSRTNKKNSKNKHKGKSSRGSTDKKHYRRHNGNSELRSKSPATGNGLFNESSVDFLDFSATGKESNCGSSFLRTSLHKVHIPFAEAT
ncbi:hypothetical protein IFM89_011960, partial [Coptis chinensis]